MKKLLLGILEAIIVLALMGVIGFFGYKMLIENRDSDSANYDSQNKEKINSLLINIKSDLDTQSIEKVVVDYPGNKVEFRTSTSKSTLFYSNTSFTYTNFLGENRVYKLINYNVKFDKENVVVNPTKATNTSSTFDVIVKYSYPTGEKDETIFTYVSKNAQLKYCAIEVGSTEKCYNTVYITYNYNYPSGEKYDEQYLAKVDEKFVFPKTKTITGYRLAGWYNEKENGKQYTESDVVDANDNGLILYAIWEPNIYKVALDENIDGAAFLYYKYNTKSEINGCIYYADANLTRCIKDPIDIKSPVGKYFDGFYTAKDGQGVQYINSNGNFVNELYKVARNDMQLYANWTTKSYSIVYDLNGGTAGAYSPLFGSLGKPVNISRPSKPGYKFKGWEATGLGPNAMFGSTVNNVSSKYEGKYPVDAPYFLNLRDQVGTVTLKAVWEEIKYRIEYNLNNGCFGKTVCDEDALKVNPTKNSILYTDWVEIPNPIKPGYKFKGWTATGVTADTAYYKETQYSMEKPWDGLSLLEPADVTQGHSTYFKGLSALGGVSVVFIANWEAIGYKIEIDPAGGRMIDEVPTSAGFSEVIKVSKPVKEGYDFAGWKVTGVDNENATIPARYGSSSQAVNQRFTNKNLDGSYLAKGEYFVGLTAQEDKVIHFEATWEVGTYTIVYNGTGATGRMAETKCERDRECLLRTNTFVKDGYVFAGWATSLNSGVVYHDGDKVTNLVQSGTKTLYAVWKKQ